MHQLHSFLCAFILRLRRPSRSSFFYYLPLSIAFTFTPQAHAFSSPSAASDALQLAFVDPSNQPVEIKGPRATPHAITLSAQASREVAQDRVQLTVFYEQNASHAVSLTTALRQKTEQALRIAKNVEGVSVQTRNFTVYPKLNAKGHPDGWQGRTELLLECTNAQDFTPIGRLAGQLSPIMQISNLRFSISPASEQAIYTQLVNEAIAAFRKEAQHTANAFGYKHYALADIAIHRNNFQIQGSTMMASTRVGIASDTADIPMERGKTTLSVTVSGVVHIVN